jgi:N-acetylmuramoyl-L-alanine amidase
MSPSLQHETRELIQKLRSKRRSRKIRRALLLGFGAIVVLAGIVTGVVLAAGGPNNEATGSTLASVKETAGTARSTTTATTAQRVTSTERVITTEPPTSSTERPATSTTAAPTTTSTAIQLAAKVVVIDPGHQGRSDSKSEPIGPGSSIKKAEVSSGTASPTTGTAESVVNLAVGLKLRDALQAKGIKVIMTRTTQNVDISNVARAQVANKANADLTIRIHCDGSTNRSVHGLFTLYPASIKGWTDDIAVASKQAATIIQRDVIATTGAQDRGLSERSDLTGFNWSDVPVALVEMGYMTNAAEDKQLESGAYQDKIVRGLVNGIVEFLRTTK